MMQPVLVLFTAMSLSFGGMQDAHAATITSVQPYLSVSYDHAQLVNGGVQYLYAVKNSGGTTAPSVNLGYIYTWLANGPQPIETTGPLTINNLKAGDTTHVGVFCPYGQGFCKWSYLAITPGTYLIDTAHGWASSP